MVISEHINIKQCKIKILKRIAERSWIRCFILLLNLRAFFPHESWPWTPFYWQCNCNKPVFRARLTPIWTQSSPWNLGMYLSPRASSELLSGLKRHTTLMQVSAASVMSRWMDRTTSPLITMWSQQTVTLLPELRSWLNKPLSV